MKPDAVEQEMSRPRFRSLQGPLLGRHGLMIVAFLGLIGGLSFGQTRNGVADEGDELTFREQLRSGHLYLSQGDIETAHEFFRGTIQSVIPADRDLHGGSTGMAWSRLSVANKHRRFRIVELGIPGLQETSRMLGELNVGIEYGLIMINLHRSEGFTLSSVGHEAMLEIARTLVMADGFIHTRAAGTEARWYANELALEASAPAQGDRRTAAEFALFLAHGVLENAAASEVRVQASRFHEQFIENCYADLRRYDELNKTVSGSQASARYDDLGTALYFTGRYLEAAMAFREALLLGLDPKWNVRSSKKYEYTLRAFARAAGGASDTLREILMSEAHRRNWLPRSSCGPMYFQRTQSEIQFPEGESGR